MQEQKTFFFCDLDGTLIRHNTNGKHTADPRDVDAIKKFQAEGNEFVVATGRSYLRAKAVLESVGVHADYMICGNGSSIYHNDERIYNVAIEKNDALDIFAYLQTQRVFAFAATFETRFLNVGGPSKLLNSLIKWKTKSENHVTDIAKKINEVEDVASIGLYSLTGTKQIDHLKGIYGEKYNFLLSGKSAKYCDITNNKATKGYAIEHLKTVLSPAWHKSIAAGDAMNDYHMFEVVDFGYKIKEGHNDLRKVAAKEINAIFEIFEIE